MASRPRVPALETTFLAKGNTIFNLGRRELRTAHGLLRRLSPAEAILARLLFEADGDDYVSSEKVEGLLTDLKTSSSQHVPSVLAGNLDRALKYIKSDITVTSGRKLGWRLKGSENVVLAAYDREQWVQLLDYRRENCVKRK